MFTQKLFFGLKDLIWKMVPRQISNRLTSIYYQRQKFKKADWMLLNVYVTGKCNLNCVSCNAFAPLAYDYMLDIASFESDCKRLAELGGDKVPAMHILGGDPLLHPQIINILDIARKYFPQAALKIVTNGILLLKMGEPFWECLKSNGVNIVISHYPIKLDIKSIRMTAKKYGVDIRYYPGKLPWNKPEYDLNGSYDPHKNYKKCRIALACVALRDGNISTCQNISNAVYFNNYYFNDKHKTANSGLQVTDADVINIYKAKTMDEILTFITHPVPFCKYCNLKAIPIKWGISKKDISEWV